MIKCSDCCSSFDGYTDSDDVSSRVSHLERSVRVLGDLVSRAQPTPTPPPPALNNTEDSKLRESLRKILGLVGEDMIIAQVQICACK